MRRSVFSLEPSTSFLSFLSNSYILRVISVEFLSLSRSKASILLSSSSLLRIMKESFYSTSSWILSRKKFISLPYCSSLFWSMAMMSFNYCISDLSATPLPAPWRSIIFLSASTSLLFNSASPYRKFSAWTDNFSFMLWIMSTWSCKVDSIYLIFSISASFFSLSFDNVSYTSLC